MIDPRAVPLILKFFFEADRKPNRLFAVQVLGQIDDPRSSRALADVAVRSRLESVRQAAIEVLKKRPRRDYVGHLAERIQRDIRYGQAGGRAGQFGAPGPRDAACPHDSDLRRAARLPAGQYVPRLYRL